MSRAVAAGSCYNDRHVLADDPASRNKDGSVVRYVQLTHNVRHPKSGLGGPYDWARAVSCELVPPPNARRVDHGPYLKSLQPSKP